jgi:hypothetical protein
MKMVDLKISAIVSTSALLLGRLLTVLTLLLALNVIPASANNKGCSNATLNGDYGFTISGYQPNPDGTMSPVKGVAITHFDGAGKLTQRDFVVTAGVVVSGTGNSVNGFQFSTGETGTYTINADCTGSAEIDSNVPLPPPLSGGVLKLMLVVTNGGRAIHTVVSEFTPPGATTPVLNTTSSDAWKIEPDLDQE